MPDPVMTGAHVPLPVRFGLDGLIPAVVQEARSGDLLMVGFMNDEALRLTRETGKVHFWSRSRARLWRKGESSGHEQIVEAIYVNCELNSLLVTVRQVGAACHDGYPSCFYRRLEPDNRLEVIRERAFDPAVVYGPQASPFGGEDDASSRLAATTRLQFGAYLFLHDHDLSDRSRTSAILRAREDRVSPRLADELRELAGVLEGTHRHGDPAADVRLEGAQVAYWTTLAAIRAGGTWEQVRPDLALLTADRELSPAATTAMLRAEAERWQSGTESDRDTVAACHATLALVGQACQVVGIAAVEVIEPDLAELRARPYLAPYFARAGA